MKTATDRGLFIRIISALVSKDTDSLRVSAGQIRSNEAEHTIAEYLWVQLKTLDKLGVCSISPNVERLWKPLTWVNSSGTYSPASLAVDTWSSTSRDTSSWRQVKPI